MFSVIDARRHARPGVGGYDQAREALSMWDAMGLVDEDVSWQDFALCKETDPDAFFPEKGGSTRDAKGMCAGCEVRELCLEYALAHDERFGIWGGLSERERRALKKARADEPAAPPAVAGS